jgi:hypothetical protein
MFRRIAGRLFFMSMDAAPFAYFRHQTVAWPWPPSASLA